MYSLYYTQKNSTYLLYLNFFRSKKVPRLWNFNLGLHFLLKEVSKVL